jgi:hypothetical protein
VRGGKRGGSREVGPEEMAGPTKGKRATGKRKEKKRGGERWTDGMDSRRRGDGLAGLYGPATCCRGRLKEKEIDRGRWDLGQGREEADLG